MICDRIGAAAALQCRRPRVLAHLLEDEGVGLAEAGERTGARADMADLDRPALRHWRGMTRSTAGAAIAPRPAVTSVRRRDAVRWRVIGMSFGMLPSRLVRRRARAPSSDAAATLARSAACSSGVHLRKPSPDLEAEPAARHQRSRDRATGRAVRSISGSTVWWIASVRSVPTRSAFSSGPSTASRRPKLALITVSTVSASQMPCSTSAIASRHSACCSRLPTKPGTSFFTCTGVLPTASCSAHGPVDRLLRRSTACRSPRPAARDTADSTNGCRARASGRVRPSMIVVIGMTEVLLARIVSRPHVLLDLGEQLLLERQIFQHRLDHVVGVAHRVGEIGDAARTRSTADGSSPRSLADWRGCAPWRCRGSPRPGRRSRRHDRRARTPARCRGPSGRRR